MSYGADMTACELFSGGLITALVTAGAIAVVGCAKGLGAIFNDGNIARLSKFYDLAHIAGIAKQMGDNDGLSAIAQTRLNCLRRHVPGSRIDISEHWNRALI